MAIQRNLLENMIRDALVNAAIRWANKQDNALDWAEAARPLLADTPAEFRASAWLNTGLVAVKTLFPDASLPATAVRRASLPLAMVNTAMREFHEIYETEQARIDAVMKGDYRNIKNKFKEKINKAANDVPNSPFGVKTREVLFEVLRHRLDEFADDGMAYSHCINVIQHAEHGVVEVRDSQIEERTSAGYGALCRRVYDVYQGSHAPGYKTLWRLKPTPAACEKPSLLINRPHRDGYDPIIGGEIGDGCWNLAGRGNIKDREQIKWILSNIWALETHHASGLIGRGTSWVWPAPDEQAPLAETLAASYARRGVEEFRESLEAADRAEWPRTLRVRQGAA